MLRASSVTASSCPSGVVLNPAHDPEGQLDAVTELALKVAR